MRELNFETGRETFSLNGTCEVSFNPTDSAFVERLYNAFQTLDQKQESYKADLAAKNQDPTAFFDLARKWDREMREVLDGLFEAPVSDAVFGSMNAYAYAGGLPVWCNLLFAVMDVVDTSVVQAPKQTSAALEKYLTKYKKRR